MITIGLVKNHKEMFFRLIKAVKRWMKHNGISQNQLTIIEPIQDSSDTSLHVEKFQLILIPIGLPAPVNEIPFWDHVHMYGGRLLYVIKAHSGTVLGFSFGDTLEKRSWFHAQSFLHFLEFALDMFTYIYFGEIYALPYSEIRYFKASGHHVRISIQQRRGYRCKGPLKTIEVDCPPYFLRINRSTLVNAYHIDHIYARTLVLSNHEALSISTRELPKVRKFLCGMSR